MEYKNSAKCCTHSGVFMGFNDTTYFRRKSMEKMNNKLSPKHLLMGAKAGSIIYIILFAALSLYGCYIQSIMWILISTLFVIYSLQSYSSIWEKICTKFPKEDKFYPDCGKRTNKKSFFIGLFYPITCYFIK